MFKVFCQFFKGKGFFVFIILALKELSVQLTILQLMRVRVVDSRALHLIIENDIKMLILFCFEILWKRTQVPYASPTHPKMKIFG